MPPPLVNPTTYESDSGEYVLEVDPTHMHGEGAAGYRLTHQGQEVWSGERPFTLLGAVREGRLTTLHPEDQP
jgi:hypothetical protein